MVASSSEKIRNSLLTGSFGSLENEYLFFESCGVFALKSANSVFQLEVQWEQIMGEII